MIDLDVLEQLARTAASDTVVVDAGDLLELVQRMRAAEDIAKLAARLSMHIGVIEVRGRRDIVAHAVTGLPETLDELRGAVERWHDNRRATEAIE